MNMQAVKQPAPLPGAANGPVMELIEVVKDLTSVMSQEIDLLRGMQIRDFGSLQERKLFLVGAYEDLAASLRKDPAFAATLDPALRQELRSLLEDMEGTMLQNEAAIRSARDANQRLAKAIVDAVTQKSSERTGYSASGRMASPPAEAPVSVQIDQHF